MYNTNFNLNQPPTQNLEKTAKMTKIGHQAPQGQANMRNVLSINAL